MPVDAVRHKFDLDPLSNEPLEYHSGLELRHKRTDAIMPANAETQVMVRKALDVEDVRVCKMACISVDCRYVNHNTET
jgi:hypothetical protein